MLAARRELFDIDPRMTEATTGLTLKTAPIHVTAGPQRVTAAFIQRFQEGSAPILQMTRRAIAGGLDLLPPDAIRHAEDVYLNQLMATEDAAEGLNAVLAKRKPVWKDK